QSRAIDNYKWGIGVSDRDGATTALRPNGARSTITVLRKIVLPNAVAHEIPRIRGRGAGDFFGADEVGTALFLISNSTRANTP
ncbi:MAG: hypothetical protein ACJ77S_11710, partial [Gemmatimonadaceae bacterium]